MSFVTNKSYASSTRIEPGPVREGFNVKVIRFENMSVQVPKKTVIKLELNGKKIGISQVINLEKSRTEINWDVFYELNDFSELTMNELAAHPLVFLNDKMLPSADVNHKREDKIKKKTTPQKNIKRSSSLGKKTQSVATRLSQTPTRAESYLENTIESFAIFGVTNLDIIPLLLGKGQLNEELLIHPPIELKGSQAIAWTKLPRMHVSVTESGNITKQFSANIKNTLYFTLESLINVTPQLTENLEVATILPRNQEFEVITFMNGSLVVDTPTDIPKRKKWQSLSNFQGQSALSNYKVNGELFDLVNTMEHEVSTLILESVPRVQWYQFHRCCFTSESLEVFKNKIVRYRSWPIEIFVSEQEKVYSESKSKSGKKSPKTASVDKPERKSSKSKIEARMKSGHYLAFLDLTRLLYPGVTSIQVASQLYTYKEGEVERKFGTEHSMFPKEHGSVAQVSVKSQSAVSKKGQSRATTPKSTKKDKSPKTEEVDEDIKEPCFLQDSEPIFNSEGEPVFLIIQIELINPLVVKMKSEEVLESICKIIPKRIEPTKEALAAINSIKSYEMCVANLMQVIHNEYQMFFSANVKLSEKTSRNFLRHLHMTGSYTKLKEAIKSAVEDYIIDVLGVPNKLIDQNMVCDIYRHLVLEMCKIIKSLVRTDFDEYSQFISCYDLLHFSTEALEENSATKAKEYLLQRIERSKKSDPEHWLDFAKFWVVQQEYEKAGECAREAIALDSKYIPALFFHGLLSWLTEDLVTAELFLSAVVYFDPHFLEGWVALHIFHKLSNNTTSASVELANGKRCVREHYKVPPDPQLSWCPGSAENSRIFLITAIKMISFSFLELAELALSHDLLLHGHTINYLYYLAVCHYLQGRYEASIQQLEEALTISWEEHHLWSLKGHNLYKLQRSEEAKHAFMLAINFLEPSEDSHLIKLRLANILVEEENYEEARRYYLTVSKDSPTPLSWLGLGITNCLDGDFKGAEIALNEANILDCRMARTWGYLALVNVMLARPNVYSKCVRQAIKYGLDDQVLMDRLNQLGEYTQPINK